MRELRLIPEESNGTSLVFALADDQDAEELFVPVTAELKDLLDRTPTDAPVARPIGSPAEDEAEDFADQQVPEEPEPTVSAPQTALVTAPREPDPGLSAPLQLRPREIQDRIRAGEPIAEVAEAAGVAESRVEPYAHPILQERAQMVDVAKRAHPIHQGTTSELTLGEVVAQGFAAHGYDLRSARWDAVRELGDNWVIQVAWQAGLSDNLAKWKVNLAGGNPTVEARTPVAADLIDPDFTQPVRTLTPLRGADLDEEEDVDGDEEIALAPASEQFEDADLTDTQEIGAPEDDFLRHPETEDADGRGAHHQPKKRRRKAVTPHWEDVLLGVRTNTKRPRK